MHDDSLDALLVELEERNVRLTIAGDRLKVDAPRGVLDDDLRAGLAAHKDGLLRHLRGPTASVGRRPATPASFAQQRLWFLERLDLGGGGHVPICVALEGALELDSLHAAINTIIARHEILRVSFAEPEADGEPPLMVVRGQLCLELARIDLAEDTDAADEDRQAQLAALASEVAWAPFDLGTGPLLRGCVVALGEAHHLLFMTFHHAVFDGGSLGCLLRELSAAYAAALEGVTPELPPLPLQYSDFALWQRRTLTRESSAALADAWRAQLAEAPALINLPCDRPRPAIMSHVGARVSRTVAAPVVAALGELSRAEQATPTTTVLAAYAVLLARYTRCDDLVIGMARADRDHEQLRDLIGLFVSALPIRLRPRPELPFAAFLAEVMGAVGWAYRNGALPFEQIVTALGVERSLAHHPVFQVTLSSLEAQSEGFEMAGVDAKLVEFEHERTTADLGLKLRWRGEQLIVIFEYRVDLFEHTTIERIADNFLTLLAAIVAQPQAPLQSLSLVAAPELEQLLHDFNRCDPEEVDVEGGFDVGPAIHEQFRLQAVAHPDAIAVTQGERSITYAELSRRANRLARHLVELGVGPEVVVALCLPRSIEIFVALLATLTAGGAYLPLDVEQPGRRLAFMLTDSQARLVLTTRELRSHLPTELDHQIIELDDDAQLEQLAGLSDRPLEPRASLDDLAYVIYTSGSTGAPKGVMVSHRAIATSHAGCRVGYHPDATRAGVSQLQMLNPAFDVFTSNWCFALCNGGRLVLCPSELLANPEALYALMVAEGTAVGTFIPGVIRRLCDYLERTGQRLDIMSCCIVGAEIVYVRDHRRLQALCRADTQITNTFGVTEAAVESTIADQRHLGTGASDTIAPIGRPMANVRIYVLDAARQPVPIGVLGELCIAGSTLARGYHGRPELTAERFVEIELPLPHRHQRERIYRTGDLARWRADGVLEFFGRLDHQVKLRGLRIEIGEIEAAMLEHSAVREAIVMLRGRDDDAMLAAWVVLREPLADAAAALREHLNARLPRYMVPSSFAVLAELPLTPNGKVDRLALPDPTSKPERRFVPPRDRVELELILIWEKLLGCSPVGVREDFFALGGDSLLAVRMISIIERRLGVRVPVRELVHNGTIEQLACALRREPGAGPEQPWSPLVCMQSAGDRRPLFFVHAAGGIVFRYVEVAALLGETRPFYAIQARGIEPGDTPYPSVEVMAADYVRAIREVQPSGPYLIGGWSFGGTVAYEMARLLADEGEQVPVVLMVDAPSPHVEAYEQDDVDFLLERLRPAAGLELERVDELDTREQKLHYLIEQQRLAGLLAPDIAVADAELRLAIHKHHNRLSCEYCPRGPCRTRIVFYEPLESLPFDRRMKEPTHAWREFALDGVEVHRAPGNHFNMFSAEHGPVLAELLRARLAELS